MERKFILSPCGTSALTNGLSSPDRNVVFAHANCKTQEEIPEKDRKLLRGIIDKKKERILSADPQEARELSAELNGIFGIYEDSLSKKEATSDYHLLLATDTWLGSETAALVESYLNKHGLNASVYRQTDLQTESLPGFQFALCELIRKFDEELPGYKMSGYRIYFNLTGGFKSVQGFLQSIANFYADETVYLFEKSRELLRIPALPVRLDFEEPIKKNLYIFRRLASRLSIEQDKAKSEIPGTMLLVLDDEVSLSAWGELCWTKTKKEIYQERLWPSPSPKIRYRPEFEKETASLPPDRRLLVNERLDDLARYLEANKEDRDKFNLRSLDFKKLKGNPKPPSTHEIDAWSDKSAKRIFGHFEKEVFVLDHIDEGLH